MHKVVVVDDHPFIRRAAKLLLSEQGVEVIGEASNGADAMQLVNKLEPDLVLLDIGLPGVDGLEVISRINKLRLPIRILVMTGLSAEVYALRCMKAGASGYISKGDDLEELGKAVKVVMSGYNYFPKLVLNSTRRSDLDATEQWLISGLSGRELEVLKRLAAGKGNKEIGEEMSLSNKTISTYKTRLRDKLNLANAVDMAEFAKRNKLF
ncbi:Virulence factors putative positive transcription regulator BvgA [Pseudomonas fluorescens]|uniref:response regulator transcription factor n=1 Tax=Pseudomonas fluorescens TaxID=294 RepID=UPI00124092B5|nr:response regulator transcription factor [Pseudomonas fluorescens]VVP32002.1 Virulence factors putative positive transcription regulator BvgA [Pseudomonas fluorescens]